MSNAFCIFCNPIFTLNFFIRIRKALENKNNMEDDRVAILEAQLAQAKLIAEEADKKYEEVKAQQQEAPNCTVLL